MTDRPMIYLHEAIAAILALNGGFCSDDHLEAAATLRALPPVTPYPLGAEWMRASCIEVYGNGGFHNDFLAIPGPTDADLDAAAMARPKVRALVEALQAMADDHMTSETHHPSHVLVPATAFYAARAAMNEVE